MTARLKINLIGPGKVGQTLGRLLADQALHSIQDVFGHNPERAAKAVAFIGDGSVVPSLAAMRPADIWLITVPDSKIGPVAEELSTLQPAVPAMAVHCSGFFPAEEMQGLRNLGWSLVSAHPVLTFADPEIAVQHFEGTCCGLEGDEPARTQVAKLFEEIGARTFAITSDGKELYHAAAVISSNFAVVLQALAREAWSQADVPDDISTELQRSMLKAVVENVTALGPEVALTGPAARGDWTVVSRQQKAVSAWHTEAGRAYESLSIMARRLKRLGSTSLPVIEES